MHKVCCPLYDVLDEMNWLSECGVRMQNLRNKRNHLWFLFLRPRLEAVYCGQHSEIDSTPQQQQQRQQADQRTGFLFLSLLPSSPLFSLFPVPLFWFSFFVFSVGRTSVKNGLYIHVDCVRRSITSKTDQPDAIIIRLAIRPLHTQTVNAEYSAGSLKVRLLAQTPSFPRPTTTSPQIWELLTNQPSGTSTVYCIVLRREDHKATLMFSSSRSEVRKLYYD